VKSRNDIFVDGSLATGLTPLASGQVVSGTDFQFRLEEINPER
jgi:hypothetical protein